MTSDDVPNLDLSCHFLHPATESSYLLPPPPILCLTTVAANWPVVSLNSVACVVEWMLLFYTSTAIAIFHYPRGSYLFLSNPNVP